MSGVFGFSRIARSWRCRRLMTAEAKSSSRSAFADDHERRPVGRIRLLRLPMINKVEHGLTHRFGAARCLVRGESAYGAGYEFDGRFRIDFPMRDEDSPGLCVYESAGESR